MDTNEVCKMLEKLKIPFVYSHFKEGSNPKLPYLLYYYNGDNLFNADGLIYYKFKKLIVELYTSKKDFELENRLEKIFLNEGIIYQKEEIWISSEQMYETIYKMEV